MGVACCHGFARSVIDGCCLLPWICQVSHRWVLLVAIDLPGHSRILVVAIDFPGQS